MNKEIMSELIDKHDRELFLDLLFDMLDKIHPNDAKLKQSLNKANVEVLESIIGELLISNDNDEKISLIKKHI